MYGVVRLVDGWGLALAVVMVGAAIAGCTGTGDGGGDAVPAADVTPEIASVLAAADRVDGTEDHVVGKCTMCGFAMSGSAEYTTTVGDYTLRHCSAGCKERFDADPIGRLAEAQLP